MLFLSIGLTWGTFCRNEGMLTRGSNTTVPESSAGSSAGISFSSAMMDAYSVPWAPETSANTGPDFAPFTTTTGMSETASTPAGTWRKPVAVWPGAAVAVPTVNDARCPNAVVATQNDQEERQTLKHKSSSERGRIARVGPSSNDCYRAET